MAKNQAKTISLKALVEKKKKKIIFVEANKDFADVLFSFLTMPMGTIIRLLRKKPPIMGTGCMNNLYESVNNLGVQQFQTAACKDMLLYPRNGAEVQCNELKLKIADAPPTKCFLCTKTVCDYKLLNDHHAICSSCEGCFIRVMNEMTKLSPYGSTVHIEDEEVFVKEETQLIISEELQVIPSSTEASLSVLSKLAVTDWTTLEECYLNITQDEVLTLLKCSLVSKTPLTETLLKYNPATDLCEEDLHQGDYIKSGTDEPPPSNVNKKIQVKLVTSKSKKMVCYAEASEDFVDLLFGFLTLPLGYIVKEMHSSISKGCINLLYNSVCELDAEKHLKSNEHKAMLVNPKLEPYFSYDNHPLGIEEYNYPPDYCADSSHNIKKTTGGGYVMGPAMFTVTDNLIVTPMSPISCVCLLKKLKVPADDIKELDVLVGHVEAKRLMVASFVSESVLTNVLLRKPIKPEY